MKEFKVPVVFMSSGFVSVQAESIEELYEKLEDVEFVNNLPLPTDAEYVEGSYEIDLEVIELHNQ